MEKLFVQVINRSALRGHIVRIHKRKPNEVCPSLFSNRTNRRFTEEELQILSASFAISIYPTVDQIYSIEQQTGLPNKTIRKWFHNNRQKDRKKNKDLPYNFNNAGTFAMSAQSDILTCITNQPSMKRHSMDQSIRSEPEVSLGGSHQQMRGPTPGLPKLSYHGPQLNIEETCGETMERCRH